MENIVGKFIQKKFLYIEFIFLLLSVIPLSVLAETTWDFHFPDSSKTTLMSQFQVNPDNSIDRDKLLHFVGENTDSICMTFTDTSILHLTGPGNAGSGYYSERPCIKDRPADKVYLFPALEIIGFAAGLNISARLLYPHKTEDSGEKTYSSNLSTSWDHLVNGPWKVDDDSFKINQLGHPYQGATYQNIARSAGLNFWEAMGYTFLGSFLWEIAGETSNPSLNDQVSSGIAGNFLGEPLFRIANLLLENTEVPDLLREMAAGMVSPATGFNRLVFDKRFPTRSPNRDPATFWRLNLGANIAAYHSGPQTSNLGQYGASVSFAMEYGLPGKPGYHYMKPFDYFRFEAGISTNYPKSLGMLSSRGLLFGTDYQAGDNYRGIWGLYGTYDYMATSPVRVSTTGISLGTTAQWWLSQGVALQGTSLGGIGYGAGGDISGSNERDYHYGGDIQGLLDLRLIFGERAFVDLRANHYYISDIVATAPKGTEAITNILLGLTLRIYEKHAIGLQYQFSNRKTRYHDVENQNQKIGVFSLVYTFLSTKELGAIDWGNRQ
ncbi:MAG: DUF3943 domain-containing protein [Syntrophorhabdaceae bacterium]